MFPLLCIGKSFWKGTVYCEREDIPRKEWAAEPRGAVLLCFMAAEAFKVKAEFSPSAALSSHFCFRSCPVFLLLPCSWELTLPIEKVSTCLQLPHVGTGQEDQELKVLFGYLSWSSTSVTWDLGSKTKTKCPTGITSPLSLEFFQFPLWPDYLSCSLDVSKKALKIFKDHNSCCIFQFVFSGKTSVNGLIC